MGNQSKSQDTYSWQSSTREWDFLEPEADGVGAVVCPKWLKVASEIDLNTPLPSISSSSGRKGRNF